MTRDQFIVTLYAGATWLLGWAVIGQIMARVINGHYLVAVIDICLVVLVYFIHRIFEDYEALM